MVATDSTEIAIRRTSDLRIDLFVRPFCAAAELRVLVVQALVRRAYPTWEDAIAMWIARKMPGRRMAAAPGDGLAGSAGSHQGDPVARDIDGHRPRLTNHVLRPS